MREKLDVIICDICKKRIGANGESYYGGHPFEGWYHISQYGGSTSRVYLNKPRDFDVCSKECAIKVFNNEYDGTPVNGAEMIENWSQFI